MLKSIGYLILIFFWIHDSLNHIPLPLFMNSKVSIAILKQLLCFYFLTKHIICIKPYVIFISKSESYSVTSVNVYNVEYCLIKTDSMLSLTN